MRHSDRERTHTFLHHFAGHEANRRHLRRLLGQFSPEINASRLSHKEALLKLGPHFHAGHIRFEIRKLTRGSNGSGQSQLVEPPNYEPGSTPPAVESTTELKTADTPSVDAIVQAGALVLAARKATPFCAKCAEMEQKRLEEEKKTIVPIEPPPIATEPVSDEVDPAAAAQAAILTEAAQDGTPFCEKCDAARNKNAA